MNKTPIKGLLKMPQKCPKIKMFIILFIFKKSSKMPQNAPKMPLNSFKYYNI